MNIMFDQTNALRDYVFPIATAEYTNDGIKIKHVLGTGFLIGNRGFALTAKHVIAELEHENLVAIFINQEDGWLGSKIINKELHDSEDVAILQLDKISEWKSFFLISNSDENSACEYHLLGYPDDITHELVSNGRTLIRPDLTYNKGYIRRRYSGEIPAIKGNSFFELSEVGGGGVSGSPVFKLANNIYEVIGIYVGEKTNDRATSVGYAIRADAFRNWTPSIVEKSIIEESRNLTTPPPLSRVPLV